MRPLGNWEMIDFSPASVHLPFLHETASSGLRQMREFEENFFASVVEVASNTDSRRNGLSAYCLDKNLKVASTSIFDVNSLVFSEMFIMGTAYQIYMADKVAETRIKKDIVEFDLKYPKIVKRAGKRYGEILDLALRYRKDTEFFLEKKDYITAFGAINYGFGLMDAVEKIVEIEKR